VRERVAGGGAPVEERPGGFLTRDPWNNAVTVTGGSRPRTPADTRPRAGDADS
jgi:hypothetical protein